MAQTALIPRPYYEALLDRYRENGLIKVVLGPRRCGKSVLLQMYEAELKAEGVAEDHCISVSLDDLTLKKLRDPDALHACVIEKTRGPGTYYVFIDEVQMCPDFHEVLASLARHPEIDLYVTGSNAFLLSGELATLLTGRFSEIRMSTFSFAEFHRACAEDGIAPQDDLLRYMQLGGFPAVTAFRHNAKAVQDYYDGLVTSVIVKDICTRLNVRDAAVLYELTVCLATSIGSLVSPKNIANTLKSAGCSISIPTIYTYLQALEDSFFFHRVPRFDVMGREVLRREEKFYLCDVGFRYSVTSSPVKDYGRILENIVYLELTRRYKKVTVGRIGEAEVDFVAESEKGFVYYQVALSVLDPQTLQRELAPLTKIRDSWPKYLITRDTLGSDRVFDGVQLINAAQWLLDSPTAAGN